MSSKKALEIDYLRLKIDSLAPVKVQKQSALPIAGLIRNTDISSRLLLKSDIKFSVDHFNFLTSAVIAGSTSNRSPAIPKSAFEKIGASSSLLMATIYLEVDMPARC